MSKINIISEESRASAIGLLQSLNLEHKWAVTIEKRKDKRSLDQNALLHRWFDIIGNELGDDPRSVKQDFKQMFAPRVRRSSHVTGGTKDDPMDTSDMDVTQFRDFMDRVDRFCASELGIVLPATHDA